jgi:hypothetical protein
LRDKIACFPAKDGAAFLSTSDALKKLELVQSNCSSSANEFFSKKSCFGDKKSKYCQEKYLGEEGALECLKSHGDIAFLNLEIFKNLTTTPQYKSKDFKVLCPFKNENKYVKNPYICYLSWTSKGVLLTNKNKSQMRINEIVNSLKAMDNHFGKQKFRSGNIPFTLFGPFDQKSNVLFKDSTDGLKTKYEMSKATFERGLENYFDSLKENYQYCESSSSGQKISIISFVISLLFTLKCHFIQ